MNAVSVLVAPGSELGLAIAPVLASLPDDFAAVSEEPEVSAEASADAGGGAHVVVVDGHHPSWPTVLGGVLGGVQGGAVHGARGVLLREPVTPTGAGNAAALLRDLARSARAAGVRVVVDRRWSGAPGVAAFTAAFGRELTDATSVTVLLTESSPALSTSDALLDALGLARAAGAPAAHLDQLHQRAGSWSARGRTTAGALLHLQGVHTSAAQGAELTATSATSWARVHVPDASSAAPATGRCADAAGERLLPTEFEPAARAAWRRLHRQLAGTGAVVDELDALAADLHVVDGRPPTPVDRPLHRPTDEPALPVSTHSASKEI